MKILLKFGLSFVVLFLLFKYVKIQGLIENLHSFSIKIIFYSLFMYLVVWTISVYRWKLLLPDMRFGRLMSVTFVGYFYSAILPGQIAGEVIKAYRLGKGRSDAEKIAASVLVDKVIGLLGLLVVASIGLMISHYSIPVEISLSIALCSLIIFIGLFSLRIPFFCLLIAALLEKIADHWPRIKCYVLRINRVLDAWESYLTKPLRLLYALMLAVVLHMICVWVIILFSFELEIDLAFADWCWIFGFVSVAVLLPISVGGIGIREGAFAGALSLHGVPIEKSIALSLVFFSITLMGALIGALLELFNSKIFKSLPRT